MSFKLKLKPEDFVVSEVITLFPSDSGDYSLYLLKKVNLTTWEALGQIAKKWHLPLKNISYGGLKDKRAITFQYITIKNGPKRDLQEKNFELIYQGKTKVPLDKSHLLGNNFEITIRNVPIREEALKREIERVNLFGLPNYFDEQRFSSISETKDFPAKEIILGNYERALYLLLVYSSFEEGRYTKKLRECLKKNWGNWANCLNFAKLSWEKNLLIFLSKHPSSKRTFKRALHLIDKDYLFFMGNVYQSFLWNEVLKEILKYFDIIEFKIPYILGELYFYKELPEGLKNTLIDLKIPFPSPKLKIEDSPQLPLKSLYLKILNNEGFSDFRDLRTFIKGLIFKTYPRPAIIFPKNLTVTKMNSKDYKFTFFLEKGSFATLVIKRLLYDY